MSKKKVAKTFFFPKRARLTLSWGGSEMYVGWGGVGKFTHPYFFLKYVPKLHQTWYFGSICDEDQKTKSVNLKSI